MEDSVTFYAFNETFFAFRFQSFKFVGDRPFVYIHCTSYVCTDEYVSAFLWYSTQ